MKQYVLGVDGGATKTHYALFDNEGNLVSFLKGGPSNHEHFADAYDGTRKELEKSINIMVRSAGLGTKDISYGVFGMAGVDITRQKDDVSQLISDLGIGCFKVYNDAFLGIKAGSEKGYGVCSINGTGTCCVGIDSLGNHIQIGGTGFMFGDSAGAGFIGEMIVKSVYDSVFRCGKPTLMKEMLLSELKVSEDGLVEAIYKMGYPRRYRLDEMAGIAYHAANMGDETAIGLLRHVGAEAAECVVGVISRLDYSGEDTVDVIMAGSQYVKGENPSTINEFKRIVTLKSRKKANFILLEAAPVAGAVLWALEELTGSRDRKIREKVLASMVNMGD